MAWSVIRIHSFVSLGAGSALVLALGACATQDQPAEPLRPGDPLPGLTADELARFEYGKAQFSRIFTVEEGLGPVFNENTCNACHSHPDVGGGGEERDVHAVRETPEGECDLLGPEGGGNVRRQSTHLLRALGTDFETIPEEATSVGYFRPPELYGMGLLEAIPGETLESMADPNDEDGDGISGRVGRYPDGTIARFRRKADVASLDEVAEAALRVELGLSTTLNPREEPISGNPVPEGADPVPDPEVGDDVIRGITDFMRFLAPLPPQLPEDPDEMAEIRRGMEAFTEVGCASCHVPALVTGPSDVEALDRKIVHLYSDLLLHDMGPELADVCGLDASASEFRTEPLMGLWVQPNFMHDGRSWTLEDAIARHGGESAASREAFNGLNARDQMAVLRFMRSL
jgi:CxxC motif-containing protein (DUF1111 family)